MIVCVFSSQLLAGHPPGSPPLPTSSFSQVLSLCLSSSRGGFCLGQTPTCSCVCLHILSFESVRCPLTLLPTHTPLLNQHFGKPKNTTHAPRTRDNRLALPATPSREAEKPDVSQGTAGSPKEKKLQRQLRASQEPEFTITVFKSWFSENRCGLRREVRGATSQVVIHSQAHNA